MDNDISRESYIYGSGLSVRATNVLLIHSEQFGVPFIPGKPYRLKIQDLEGFPKKRLNQMRNAGTKTIAEIETLCKRAGVNLLD